MQSLLDDPKLASREEAWLKILTFHHIGLSVQDMQRSLSFYCGLLGMRVMLQREITTPWVGIANGVPCKQLNVAFLDAYGQTIELLEFVDPKGEAVVSAANQPGTTHLTFIVEDIENAYQKLSNDGVRFVSPPQKNTEGPNAGSKVAFFLDPDGIRIELVQPAHNRSQVP